FTPSTDAPKLLGRIIFITGGTSATGHSTLLHLCTLSPAEIYFSGRSHAAATALIARVAALAPSVVLHFVQMDMTDLSSIKTAITTKFRNIRLHLLICCAGINAKDTLAINSLTKNGYERNLGVNHLAHALVLKLLLPTLLRTAASRPSADVRVVVLTCPQFRNASTVSLAKARSITAEYANSYAESRFAAVVYNCALAVRCRKITAVTVLPG
ncbi:NAD(P)-binding protein, partial [Mytilinidion resinicola]